MNVVEADDLCSAIAAICAEVTRHGATDPEFACQHGQRLLSKWIGADRSRRPVDKVAARAELDRAILAAVAQAPPASSAPVVRPAPPPPPPGITDEDIFRAIGGALETTMDGSPERRRALTARAMTAIDALLEQRRAGPIARWRIRRTARKLIAGELRHLAPPH